MGRFRVRQSRTGDEAEIAVVLASATATLRQTYRPTAVAIARRQGRASPLPRLVAVVGDKIVGTVEYELVGERLHLLGLGVLEAHRGRGVARRLIETVCQIAGRSGARKVSLYTIRETGNLPLFARLGFAVAGEALSSDFTSERHQTLTEVYMERSLPGAGS
jgi:predicted N-acetyltransferase YhbS